MIRCSFDPGDTRGGDRFADEMRFAARPLVHGLVAAALERAHRRHGRRRDEELAFEAGTRIDIQVDADELVAALRAAAVDGLQSFIAGLEEGLRAMEATAETSAPPKPARPKARPKAKPGKRRSSPKAGAAAG